jgi:hypothetical protein
MCEIGGEEQACWEEELWDEIKQSEGMQRFESELRWGCVRWDQRDVEYGLQMSRGDEARNVRLSEQETRDQWEDEFEMCVCVSRDEQDELSWIGDIPDLPDPPEPPPMRETERERERESVGVC